MTERRMRNSHRGSVSLRTVAVVAVVIILANQRAVQLEGVEGPAQIVQLLHGVLHRFTSATMDAISSPQLHSISLGGLRTPTPCAWPHRHGPASENLHNRRRRACISYDEESATEMAISKCPGQCRGFEDFDLSVVD
jgi:hypothetical protein